MTANDFVAQPVPPLLGEAPIGVRSRALSPPRPAARTPYHHLLARLGRLAIRLPAFAGILLAAAMDYAWRWRRERAGWGMAHRAEWMRHWSCRLLRLMNVRVTVWGEPPARGVLVSNHLSYLDVLVLASVQPLVFVAKAEVRRWPVFGALARLAGTLFIDRERRGDVLRLGEEFTPLVSRGSVLVLFPEGTSSDGESVLPFHSSLLAPAVEHRWPATPAWLGYALEDGDPRDEVCYWRDMVFLPHLLNLLTKREIRACLIYGDPVAGGRDRKWLARELHTRVCDLRVAGKAIVTIR